MATKWKGTEGGEIYCLLATKVLLSNPRGKNCQTVMVFTVNFQL